MPTDAVLIPDLKLRLESKRNRDHLTWAEEQIVKGMENIAKILAEVRDRRSWEGHHESLSAWAKHSLNLSRVRVIQILGGHDARQLLLGSGDEEVKLVAESMSEAAARELQGLSAQRAVEVVKEVAASGKITALRIRRTAGRRPVKRVKHRCPKCGQEF